MGLRQQLRVKKRPVDEDHRTRVVLARLDAAVEQYNRKAMQVELAIRAAEKNARERGES